MHSESTAHWFLHRMSSSSISCVICCIMLQWFQQINSYSLPWFSVLLWRYINVECIEMCLCKYVDVGMNDNYTGKMHTNKSSHAGYASETQTGSKTHVHLRTCASPGWATLTYDTLWWSDAGHLTTKHMHILTLLHLCMCYEPVTAIGSWSPSWVQNVGPTPH